MKISFYELFATMLISAGLIGNLDALPNRIIRDFQSTNQEPVNENSKVSEPVEENSVGSEPVEESSKVSEPVEENSKVSEPVAVNSVGSEPAKGISGSDEPAKENSGISTSAEENPVNSGSNNDSTEIIRTLFNQLDENTATKVPFYLPLVDIINKANVLYYPSVKVISIFKYTGFGPEGIDRLFPGIDIINATVGNEPVETQVKDCQVTSLRRPVCASDGKMYRNLGHMQCARREKKDLVVVWDGPCDRKDWPIATFESNGTRLILTNPEIITKFVI